MRCPQSTDHHDQAPRAVRAGDGGLGIAETETSCGPGRHHVPGGAVVLHADVWAEIHAVLPDLEDSAGAIGQKEGKNRGRALGQPEASGSASGNPGCSQVGSKVPQTETDTRAVAGSHERAAQPVGDDEGVVVGTGPDLLT